MTTVFDLKNPANVCDPVPDYPLEMTQGTGGLIDNQFPVVCGGSGVSGYLNQCFIFRSNQWEFLLNMTSSRDEAASVMIDNTMWILGGRDAKGVSLNTTEFIGGKTTLAGPEMPLATRNHCVMKINETAIMTTGGKPFTWFGNRTDIYNFETGQWTSGIQ